MIYNKSQQSETRKSLCYNANYDDNNKNDDDVDDVVDENEFEN
jgi:hypothetical protein